MTVDIFGRCHGCGEHVTSSGGCIRCSWPVGCAPSIVAVPYTLTFPTTITTVASPKWPLPPDDGAPIFIPTVLSVGDS